MKNKKGFTLTEVLLAVMIVGLISISLAALTRAAARESGVGRSRIMLRNNLSSFMRTLRTDIMSASRVYECALCAGEGDSAEFIMDAGASKLLLRLGKNTTLSEEEIITSETRKAVMYCFVNGTNSTNIMPEGALRGGQIYRYEYLADDSPDCSDAIENGKVVLNNVKYIPSSAGYAVPMVGRRFFSREGLNSVLRVNIITELDSTPIVNETAEETFVVPIGF